MLKGENWRGGSAPGHFATKNDENTQPALRSAREAMARLAVALVCSAALNAFYARATAVPTAFPTALPTTYPTPYPSTFAPGPNLDVYFILDQSRSILYANQKCQAQNGKSCWVLAVDFIDLTQQQLAARVGGYYDPTTGHGLRVYLSTFTCLNLQPLFKVHMQLNGDPAQITNILNQMRGMQPKYGTCPSLGLQMIRQSIAKHKSDVRFNQAVNIISDGRVSQIDRAKTLQAAGNLALADGVMWAAAVGQAIDQTMLVQICGGDATRVVQVSDYSTLASVLKPAGGAFRVASGIASRFGLGLNTSMAPTPQPVSALSSAPSVPAATKGSAAPVTGGGFVLYQKPTASPSSVVAASDQDASTSSQTQITYEVAAAAGGGGLLALAVAAVVVLRRRSHRKGAPRADDLGVVVAPTAPAATHARAGLVVFVDA